VNGRGRIGLGWVILIGETRKRVRPRKCKGVVGRGREEGKLPGGFRA